MGEMLCESGRDAVCVCVCARRDAVFVGVCAGMCLFGRTDHSLDGADEIQPILPRTLGTGSSRGLPRLLVLFCEGKKREMK